MLRWKQGYNEELKKRKQRVEFLPSRCERKVRLRGVANDKGLCLFSHW